MEYAHHVTNVGQFARCSDGQTDGRQPSVYLCTDGLKRRNVGRVLYLLGTQRALTVMEGPTVCLTNWWILLYLQWERTYLLCLWYPHVCDVSWSCLIGLHSLTLPFLSPNLLWDNYAAFKWEVKFGSGLLLYPLGFHVANLTHPLFPFKHTLASSSVLAYRLYANLIRLCILHVRNPFPLACIEVPQVTR